MIKDYGMSPSRPDTAWLSWTHSKFRFLHRVSKRRDLSTVRHGRRIHWGPYPSLLCYLLPTDWRRVRILTSCIPTDSFQHGSLLRHSNNAKKYISQFYFKTVRNALPILTHVSDILIYCIFFLPGNFLGTLKTFVLFYPMSVILNLEAIKLGIINSRPLGMF